jgi:hypothetical protein
MTICNGNNRFLSWINSEDLQAEEYENCSILKKTAQLSW